VQRLLSGRDAPQRRRRQGGDRRGRPEHRGGHSRQQRQLDRRADADEGGVMARFAVNYTIHGRATDIVEATSLPEAIAMIEAKVDRDDFHIDLDDVDDVDFNVAEMHPVTREGREIWTTYV